MIWKQMAATFRKPGIWFKLLLISVLFVFSMMEQIDITTEYARSFGDCGNMNVITLMIHTFNYFYFYVDILIIGFIFLIPDIVKDEHMERKLLMCQGSRKAAGKYAVLKIICFSILYVLWFVVLAFIIGGIGLRDFSLTWPHFMEIMQRKIKMEGRFATGVINLSIGTLEYPTVVVLFLMMLRAILGFSFLGLLALFVTQVTARTRNGIGILVILEVISAHVYLYPSIYYWDKSKPEGMHITGIRIVKATIIPLFSSCSVSDAFVPWMRYALVTSTILCVIMAAAVMAYYRKGDLGDADRDE